MPQLHLSQDEHTINGSWASSCQDVVMLQVLHIIFNPLRTSPGYTLAGVYVKCVLKQNQIIFNGLRKGVGYLGKLVASCSKLNISLSMVVRMKHWTELHLAIHWQTKMGVLICFLELFWSLRSRLFPFSLKRKKSIRTRALTLKYSSQKYCLHTKWVY